MIKVGERLPDATLFEFVEDVREGCTIGPNSFDVREATRAKRVVIFGLPGAFTPTCSAKHVPGYVEKADALRAAGIDEIWCVSVNDAFVMGAWGKQAGADGKVTMLAEGNGDFAEALGLTMDGSKFGMGKRGSRWSAIVDDGVVRELNVEEPGAFNVSSAEFLIGQL